jgi:hypothetical protein
MRSDVSRDEEKGLSESCASPCGCPKPTAVKQKNEAIRVSSLPGFLNWG